MNKEKYNKKIDEAENRISEVIDDMILSMKLDPSGKLLIADKLMKRYKEEIDNLGEVVGVKELDTVRISESIDN